jgi:hypothetical protein
VTGTWTSEPVDRARGAVLLRDLDISGVTGSVLVGRGYDDP